MKQDGLPGALHCVTLTPEDCLPPAAPVADDQSVTTPEDTQLSIVLTASDADGDPLTYAIVSQPAHGSLGGTAPNVTYTPLHDYSGPDSFTFRANDGQADSNIATVSIEVEVAPGGLQLPGDCNQDGELDQSDAICILSYVFLGGPPEVLPCGEGGAGNPGNLRLLDFNNDSGLDQSDAIGILMWRFLGGAPHFLGPSCRPIPGCLESPENCAP